MNNKKFLIYICIAIFSLIIMLLSVFFAINIFLPKNMAKIQNKEIISILKTNNDALDFINKYNDFKIEKKEILTKESILAGQNAQNFKEVYQGLELENNRYLKVDLINSNNSNGLIAVLDFRKNQAVKVFGILMLESK